MKPIPTRRLNGTILVLLAAAWVGSPLPRGWAQTGPPDPLAPVPRPPALLRLQRNVPGDSQPILLDADEVLTWKQQGQRVILLQGQVLIQQATVRIRCGAAVAFVNLDRLQRTGILHADLYAEQDVRLDDGTGTRKGQRGLFDLNSRGELSGYPPFGANSLSAQARIMSGSMANGFGVVERGCGWAGAGSCRLIHVPFETDSENGPAGEGQRPTKAVALSRQPRFREG